MKIIVGLVGLMMGVFPLFSGGNNEVDLLYETEVKDIATIEIETSSDEVTIYIVEGSKIKAHLHGQYVSDKDAVDLVSDKNGTSLFLSIHFDKIFDLASVSRRLKLDVYIPEQFSKRLSVSTTSANITSQDELKIKDITLEVTSGEIYMNSIQADRIDVIATSGSVNVNTLQADRINMKVSSGNIDIQRIDLKEAEIAATSGNIDISGACEVIFITTTSGSVRSSELTTRNAEFESSSGIYHISDFTGNVKFKGTSGSFYLAYKESNMDVQAKINSGDIRLNIPHPDAYYEYHTNSGSFSSDFPLQVIENRKGKSYRGLIGEGNYRIVVETSSGSLEIKK